MLIWLCWFSICMATSYGGWGGKKTQCQGALNDTSLQLSSSPESLASPHPQAKSETWAPVYTGWANLQLRGNGRAQTGLLVVRVILWKHGFLHLDIFWLASQTCVKSLQERAAMENKENINRVGPLRRQSINNVHAKNFTATEDNASSFG